MFAFFTFKISFIKNKYKTKTVLIPPTSMLLMSTDMIKQTIDIDLPTMTQILNMSIDNASYLYNPKLPEVSPAFKKNGDLDKENCRPISVLTDVTKVFERIMYQQK